MYNVTELCNKLNKAGIECITYNALERKQDVWSADNGMILSLTHMPEENFQKLVEMDYTGLKDFQSVYSEWGQYGYLRFKPFVRESKGKVNPTLTIRHDRHLHMFRGYYFQVSGTPDGIGSAETGSYRIGFLTGHDIDDEELWSSSILANMLCYAALLDTAYVFDNFREWFNTHTDEVDTFMKSSMSFWRMNLKYGWSDLQKYITKENDWTDPDRRIYKVTCKKGTLCEFAYGKKTVQVRTALNGKEPSILTVRVPNAFEGISDLDDWDAEDLEIFRIDVTMQRIGIASEERVDIKMILIMAMALAGMRINWMACYCVQKCRIIKDTNRPGVIEVNTLNDIANNEPDEF